DTYQRADAYLREAEELYRRAGDRIGEARSRLDLARTAARQGRLREAADLARAAAEECDVPSLVAAALNVIGWHRAHLGEFGAALEACQRSLALHLERGTPHGRASTLDSLGYIHQRTGDEDAAIACYRAALDT